MKCPVCQTINSDNVSSCSECHSDLEAFTQLNFLDDQIKTKGRIVMFLSVALGLLVLSGGFLLMNMSGTEAPINYSKELKKSSDDNLILEAQVKDLNEQLSKANGSLERLQNSQEAIQGENAQETESQSSEPSAKTHTVKEGESLWSISTDHYGDGNKYNKLVQQNNIENPNMISVGITLIL